MTWSMDFLPFLICQDGSARRLVGPEGFEALRLNTGSLRIVGKEVCGAHDAHRPVIPRVPLQQVCFVSNAAWRVITSFLY